jgi:hypothetical protein
MCAEGKNVVEAMYAWPVEFLADIFVSKLLKNGPNRRRTLALDKQVHQ